MRGRSTSGICVRKQCLKIESHSSLGMAVRLFGSLYGGSCCLCLGLFLGNAEGVDDVAGQILYRELCFIALDIRNDEVFNGVGDVAKPF